MATKPNCTLEDDAGTRSFIRAFAATHDGGFPVRLMYHAWCAKHRDFHPIVVELSSVDPA